MEQLNLVDTLVMLSDHCQLDKLILIGSWAEYLYEKCSLIDPFISTTKTEDIDFLIPDYRKSYESFDLFKLFREHDFEIDQSRSGLVCFRKANFEVEFITRQYGKPNSPVTYKPYGFKVEALTHLELLTRNIIRVNFNGLFIDVPDPVAFLFHKMIIHSKRGNKKEKDKIAINNLIFYLSENETIFSKAEIIFNQLSKKEKKLITDYIRYNDLNFDWLCTIIE